MSLSLADKIKGFRISGALLYEIAFIYCFTVAFLQTTLFTAFFDKGLFRYLLMIGLLLVLFKIFFLDQQSIRTFCFNLIVLAILALTWRRASDFTMLTMGVFVIGARGVDFRRIVRDYFIVGIILLIGTILCSQLGIIKNLVYTRFGTNIHRQSFGIVYSTDFAAHVVYLFLAYCYLRFKRLSWPTYLAAIIAALAVYKLCDARFDTLALLVLVPVLIIGKRAYSGHPNSYFIASFYWTIPVLFAYITQVCAYFYSPHNHILNSINKGLSGRLALSHQAFSQYGLSLFGKHVIEHGWGNASGLQMFLNNPGRYFYIDSSFIRVLIMYGIIVALMLLVTMTVISWRSVTKGSFALASILVVVSLSAVVEQHLFDLGFDPFLLALFANVYSSQSFIKGDQS